MWVEPPLGPFRALARFKKVLFRASKKAKKVKVEATTINLKVSQRVALFRLVTAAIQEGPRVEALLALNPSLGEFVSFDGPRWVPVGLEEATRDSIASVAASSHEGKTPNVLRS